MYRILLVDPDPAGRLRLREQLDGLGLDLVDAPSGEEALLLAAGGRFDLVLLELLLPGLHGFATAERLLEMSGDRALPIVVVTSLHDASSRALAFRSGVDEFLTRPVDTIELRVRVERMLGRSRNREALRRANAELIELQRFREEMALLLVHDLKSPLTAALMNLELLRDEGLPVADRLEMIEDTRLSALRILRMVRNLVDVERLESDRVEPRIETIEVRALFDAVLEPRRAILRHRRIHIEVDDAGQVAMVDRDLITRALENIIDSGLRRTPDDGALAMRARQHGDRLELRLGNSGPPIPAPQRDRMFDKFNRSDDAERSNAGLGMYFCRLAVAAHGGGLALAEEPGLPVVVVIDLPSPPQLAIGTTKPGPAVPRR